MTFALSRPSAGHLDLVTGVRLYHRVQGDPDGDVLVFVHGWPDSWYSFSRVLGLLPQRYRAVSPDLRGFGRSDRPADGYAIDDFARDVLATLDALGIQRATLVGHSMGSFVARRLAVSRPDLGAQARAHRDRGRRRQRRSPRGRRRGTGLAGPGAG